MLIAIYDANKDKKLNSEMFERLIDENFYPEKYKAVSNKLFDKIDYYIEKRKISEGRRKGIKEMKRALQHYEIFTQHLHDSSFRLDFDTIDKERVEDLYSFF